MFMVCLSNCKLFTRTGQTDKNKTKTPDTAPAGDAV